SIAQQLYRPSPKGPPAMPEEKVGEETKLRKIRGVQVFARRDGAGRASVVDAIDEDGDAIRAIADRLQRRGYGVMRRRGPRAGRAFHLFKARWAADAVVWAAGHDRRNILVGWPTVEAVVGNKVAPGLLDHDLARNGYDAQQTDEPADPSR